MGDAQETIGTVVAAHAALLPGGWARDVRITLANGRIAGIETGGASEHFRQAIRLRSCAIRRGDG